MKQTKLFIATLLAGAVMAMPQKAWAEGLPDAWSTPISNAATQLNGYAGKYVYIYAVKGGTTYYLHKQNSKDYVESSTSAKTAFLMLPSVATGGLSDTKNAIWQFYYAGTNKFFTNSAGTGWGNSLRLTQERDGGSSTWDSQLFLYDTTEGAFAIRSTNNGDSYNTASVSSYSVNCFWTVVTETDATYTSTGVGYAIGTPDVPEYIWHIEEATDVTAFNWASPFISEDNAKGVFISAKYGIDECPWRIYKRRGSNGYADNPDYYGGGVYRRGNGKAQLLSYDGSFVAANDNYDYSVGPAFKNTTGAGAWFRVEIDVNNTCETESHLSIFSNRSAISGQTLTDATADYSLTMAGSTNNITATYCVYLAAENYIFFSPKYESATTTGKFNTLSVTPLTSYTMTVNNWATLCLPFSTDALPAGITAYDLTDVDGSDNIQGTIVSAITANKPVLLKASGSVEATFTSNGTIAASGDATTNGLLTGVYAPYTTVAGDYVLQKHSENYAFYLVEDTKPTVKPFRAYMPASAGVKALSLSFNGFETGVEMVQGEGFKVKDSRIYNLSGQRLSKAHKGLNIVNGIKYVVK